MTRCVRSTEELPVTGFVSFLSQSLSMPIDALRLIRKLPGGAQAHLIEATDGDYYVVKFLNNPQHRRILINEWISSKLLQYLGITTPRTEIVRITSEFLRLNPEVYIENKSRRYEVEPGLHFGSRFPGDPKREFVHDFLPDALLRQVSNLDEFCGVLAFDKWTLNADARQAVFTRTPLVREPSGVESHSRHPAFIAHMIDNGFAFQGHEWTLFGDSRAQGPYHRQVVYTAVRGLADFEPWLTRITNLPEEVLQRTVDDLPRSWIEGSEDALFTLLIRLSKRQRRVPDLIEELRSTEKNWFPAWL